MVGIISAIAKFLSDRRKDFYGLTESEARAILMENPARAYGFDLDALAPHIERVGVDAAELLDPFDDDPGGGGIGFLRKGHAPLVPAGGS